MKIAMIMLAAGNSRRFGGNKLLHEVDGLPMYRHILNALVEAENRISKICNKTGSVSKNKVDNEAKNKMKSIIENKKINEEGFVQCDITVVTQYETIAETARENKVQVFYNPHPERGISSSIQIGLKGNSGADAALFTVSDQPWLTSGTISRLIETFLYSDKGIACVSCKGKLGNPCIFSKKYFEELLNLEGDKGGKKVIMKHLEDTLICELKDDRELEDIDYRNGKS